MRTKPDFGEENKSQSDSVKMQNLVQQNPFTKYKFITKIWKGTLRKVKKEKRRPAGKRQEEGKRKRKRTEREDKMSLSTTKVQKLTCPVALEPCYVIEQNTKHAEIVLYLPSLPLQEVNKEAPLKGT